MAGYVKLFSDIVDSSIWEESPETCKVWVTLLALADADGFVRGSVGWLAGKSRVSLEHCEQSVSKFQQPDARSRTPDNDGRRIEQLDDGWLILNYMSFRERLSNDPKATATRERVRKHREKHEQRYKALRNTSSVTSAVSASASAFVHASGDGGGGEGREIFDFKKAFAMTMNAAIPEDFCRMVYDKWDERSGADGAGVRVDWVKHVCNRWKNEQHQWKAKTHRGHPEFRLSKNGRPEPSNKEKQLALLRQEHDMISAPDTRAELQRKIRALEAT
jgi:hypothetical protein